MFFENSILSDFCLHNYLQASEVNTNLDEEFISSHKQDRFLLTYLARHRLY